MIFTARRQARIASDALKEYTEIIQAMQAALSDADPVYITLRRIPWYGPWWTWSATNVAVKALMLSDEFCELNSQLKDMNAEWFMTPDGMAVVSGS